MCSWRLVFACAVVALEPVQLLMHDVELHIMQTEESMLRAHATAVANEVWPLVQEDVPAEFPAENAWPLLENISKALTELDVYVAVFYQKQI